MLPEKLEKILEELKSEKWIQDLSKNAELYVVGGTIRDAFINKPMKDIDMVVDGLSIDGILKILKKYGRANLEGESFSVIKFRPTGYEGEDYDIAVPREDKKVGEGHKGFEINTEGVDILMDLKRRDFTINSIAVNIITGELLDPFNGRQDLRKALMKATDETAFIEDPLRILRGIQFASRFGFRIEPRTLKLMQENSHLVDEIAGERIFDEFQKILDKEGDTQLAFDLLHKTGVDKALFDKKMLHYEKGFDNLDPISFYLVLGLVGDVNPYEFYMKKLKGSDANKVGTGIKILDNILLKWEQMSEEDRKFMTMEVMSKNPKVADATLTPGEMDDIVLQMRLERIPMEFSDVLVDGNDVMKMFNIPKSKPVGVILTQMRKDALMNKYDWKSKTSTMEYMLNLDI